MLFTLSFSIDGKTDSSDFNLKTGLILGGIPVFDATIPECVTFNNTLSFDLLLHLWGQFGCRWRSWRWSFSCLKEQEKI